MKKLRFFALPKDWWEEGTGEGKNKPRKLFNIRRDYNRLLTKVLLIYDPILCTLFNSYTFNGN